MNKINRQMGFTMIELLIVIAIIGVLSTFAFISSKESRQKAVNAQKKSDLSLIIKAIQMYYLDEGTMPIDVNNCPQSGTAYCVIGKPGTRSCSTDICLGDLVTKGYIKSLPTSPDSNPYIYYDDPVNLKFITVLTKMTPLEYGPGRRFTAMCSTTPQFYCLEFDK